MAVPSATIKDNRSLRELLLRRNAVIGTRKIVGANIARTCRIAARWRADSGCAFGSGQKVSCISRLQGACARHARSLALRGTLVLCIVLGSPLACNRPQASLIVALAGKADQVRPGRPCSSNLRENALLTAGKPIRPGRNSPAARRCFDSQDARRLGHPVWHTTAASPSSVLGRQKSDGDPSAPRAPPPTGVDLS